MMSVQTPGEAVGGIGLVPITGLSTTAVDADVRPGTEGLSYADITLGPDSSNVPYTLIEGSTVFLDSVEDDTKVETTIFGSSNLHHDIRLEYNGKNTP